MSQSRDVKHHCMKCMGIINIYVATQIRARYYEKVFNWCILLGREFSNVVIAPHFISLKVRGHFGILCLKKHLVLKA